MGLSIHKFKFFKIHILNSKSDFEKDERNQAIMEGTTNFKLENKLKYYLSIFSTVSAQIDRNRGDGCFDCVEYSFTPTEINPNTIFKNITKVESGWKWKIDNDLANTKALIYFIDLHNCVSYSQSQKE